MGPFASPGDGLFTLGDGFGRACTLRGVNLHAEPFSFGNSHVSSIARSSNGGAVSQTILMGSCLCGAVEYEVTGEAKLFYHCHCSRCRKATGTGHASNLFLQPAALKWRIGQKHIRAFKVPEAKRFTNQFCGLCGGRLPRQPDDTDTVIIPAGSLDDDAPIRPQARIFIDSGASWSCSGDEMPIYPGFPPR